MKLRLGTVQFGMDYGILGNKKPAFEDAISWLDYATQNGISAIDTARAYGTAEEVVGEFIRRKTIPREKLTISTKMRPNMLEELAPDVYEKTILGELKKQLQVLNTDYVDEYVFHSARYAFDKDKLKAIQIAKKYGLAKEVGVSVYEPEEAIACIESGMVDFIQMPYSIFDQRMKKADVFRKANNACIKVDTRSAFIQGLIMMEEDQVPDFLVEAKPIVRKITEICEEENLNKIHLAISYVKREREISHLVFGVDSLEQLKQDIGFFEKDIDETLLDKIGKQFDDIKAEIVMPSLWKK